MDIPSIETFLMVAKKQSFSLAAEEMFLTQPAISKRISSLEAELNSQLFDRLRKKIILTEAGRLFLPSARRIIDELKNSKNILAKIEGIISGELLMATSHHIGLHHLPPLLKDYVSKYPKVDLNLAFMDSESACRAVEKAEIELAVITLPNKPSECLNVKKIWSDPLCIMVHNQHPILKNRHSQNKSTTIHQLAQYPAILPEKGTYTRELIDHYFEKLNIELQIKLSNNYLETIKMMVSVGLGWSILPKTMLDESLSSIHFADFTAQRSLGIVIHKTRSLSYSAQKMVDLLLNLKN
ncbi:MAG: LysR family transcriptional regulator [gamma proteobacterium symbiont of Taylorina sp.]|nr:LysR family transcriptional regulator [gamma proteobacterium symbiont of Taylorina sp.]